MEVETEEIESMVGFTDHFQLQKFRLPVKRNTKLLRGYCSENGIEIEEKMG